MPRAYQCRGCHFKSVLTWEGTRCPGCGRFFNIRDIASDMPGAERMAAVDGEVLSLQDAIEVAEEDDRIEIGMPHVDRVLGGGIVPGSLILICGDPGVGKSTALLQVFRSLAMRKHEVLYITGEETISRVARRAKTLGRFPARMQAVHETDLEAVLGHISEHHPAVAAIDSVQMLDVEEDLEPGSATSIKIAIKKLMKCAQNEGTAIFVVGHVTKDGSIGGPRALEHLVDVSLYFAGDPKKGERVLRCDHKNRFGRTPVKATFEMTNKGLIEVDDSEEDTFSEPEPSTTKTARKTTRKASSSKSEPTPPVPAKTTTKTTPKKSSSPKKPAKKPSLSSKKTPESAPSKKDEPEAPWVSHDGLTADEVLKQSCDAAGCGVGPGRACTSASGKREAGFHESRVDKARAAKLGKSPNVVAVVLPRPEESASPDPFAKKFGGKPRLRAPRASPKSRV